MNNRKLLKNRIHLIILLQYFINANKVISACHLYPLYNDSCNKKIQKGIFN